MRYSPAMPGSHYHEIKDSLRQLYLGDPRPWLVGFSGGNWVARATRLRVSATRRRNTMLASLVFDAVQFVPPERRSKPVTILCTDARSAVTSYTKGTKGTKNWKCRRCHPLRLERGEGRGELSISTAFPFRHSAFAISTARQKGIIMSDWKETNRLRELQEQIAAEKGIRADTLRCRRFFRLASQSRRSQTSCRLAR